MRALRGKPRLVARPVSLCAAVAALAVAVSACSETAADDPGVGAGAGGTDNGNVPVCPEPPPPLGSPCSSEGLSCALGPQNPCEAAPAVCVDGVWQERSPEYCGHCPATLPVGAPACGPVGLECTYPVDHATSEGTGGGGVLGCDVYTDRAVCAPDGAWTVGTVTQNICEPCPDSLPSHGSPCFVARGCAYAIDTPCGTRDAEALCNLAAGTWVVSLPPCLCDAIADETVCAIATGCLWVDPGPCAPLGFAPSCRPVSCSETVCDAGEVCAEACDATVPECDCSTAPRVCGPAV